MSNFLWHEVSEKEKEKIQVQAKQIMDSFSEKLSKVGELKEAGVERKECEREEGKFKCAEIDRKIMFDNAPEKNDDFIIAETKKW